MAAPIYRVGGAGGSTGSDLATRKPLYTSGGIYYLDSVTGNDGYAGTDRKVPFATLATALAAMSSGDMLVVFSTHIETITVGVSSALDNICIAGEGSGDTRPKFTRGADVVTLALTGDNVTLDNLYFAESTVATANPMVTRTSGGAGEYFTIRNCYFEGGQHDDTYLVRDLGTAGIVHISDTYFVSTATDRAARPAVGLNLNVGATLLVMSMVTFDGGSVGWSDDAFNSDAAITNMRCTNIDLLNSSVVDLPTACAGYFHTRNATGGSRVEWDS